MSVQSASHVPNCEQNLKPMPDLRCRDEQCTTTFPGVAFLSIETIGKSGETVVAGTLHTTGAVELALSLQSDLIKFPRSSA